MTEWQGKNLLCYGDNLVFLSDRTLFPDECVDLIYLDPPFNSQQSYNVLFKEAAGAPSAAQIKAFEDTWTWDMSAYRRGLQPSMLAHSRQDCCCHSPATALESPRHG